MGEQFDRAMARSSRLIQKYLVDELAPQWKDHPKGEPDWNHLIHMAKDLAIKSGELKGSIKVKLFDPQHPEYETTKHLAFYPPTWVERGKDDKPQDFYDRNITIHHYPNGSLQLFPIAAPRIGAMNVADNQALSLSLEIGLDLVNLVYPFSSCWQNPEIWLNKYSDKLKQIGPNVSFYVLPIIS